jgi:CspA family cold shock protein
VTERQGETRRVKGKVKWFDPVKGFGFVVADEDGPDILLHANVLRNFGQSSVADRAEIELEVQETSRGLQAVEIHSVVAPEEEPVSRLADFEEFDAETLENLPLEPARVKWFDKAKGFGFANTFGSSEDVFVHMDVLRRSGMADLMSGEALSMRVVEGKRGRMATEVVGWDAAVKSSD